MAGLVSIPISVLLGDHEIFDITLNNAMICPADAGWEQQGGMCRPAQLPTRTGNVKL